MMTMWLGCFIMNSLGRPKIIGYGAYDQKVFGQQPRAEFPTPGNAMELFYLQNFAHTIRMPDIKYPASAVDCQAYSIQQTRVQSRESRVEGPFDP